MEIHTGIWLATAMWLSPVDRQSAERRDGMLCIFLSIFPFHFLIGKMNECGVLCSYI